MIIHNCEQNSDEWMALRAGRPTSSNAKLLITSNGEPSKSMRDYAIRLACEKYAGRPMDADDGAFSGNAYTERGHEKELDAIAWYQNHRSVEVVRTGFITTDDGQAGSSPDGLVGDDGMVEIKCLKFDNHVKAMMYVQKYGKVQPEYVAQVQDQMLVCERSWCDSVFYHPTLPPFIVRNEPIDKLQRGLIEQKKNVIAERDSIYAAIMKQEFAA